MIDSRDSILHVVVGDSQWANAPIRYRRHRLAESIARHVTTADVFWIYPRRQVGLRGSPSESHASRQVETWKETPQLRIREFGISRRRRITQYTELLHGRLLREVAGLIRRHPAPRKVLWFTIPVYHGLLCACDWDQVIYDCSDLWSKQGGQSTLRARLGARFCARSEARIIRSSHLHFASSSRLAERLRDTFGCPSILIENGVDADRFRDAVSARDGELPRRPRLAFFGPLGQYRIDFDLLCSVALAMPDCSIVLVGTLTHRVPQLERLLQFPNVTWLGASHPDEVPGLMKLMDLGLLPYRARAFQDAIFPVKFFEYLAAGLPIVGCALPSTRAHVQDGVYIHTESKAETFVAACRRALTWEKEAPRRVEIARRNDWSPKTTSMLDEVLRHTRGVDGLAEQSSRAS